MEHGLVEGLDAEAQVVDAEITEALEIGFRRVPRQHFDGSLPEDRQFLHDVPEFIDTQCRRAAADVE